MWDVVVCDGNQTEREQLLEYIRRYGSEKKEVVSARGCADWPGLVEQLKEGEPEILVIAEDGVSGLDFIISAHLPRAKLIWFSDLDFAIQAYRLCVSWFGQKPVTYQKMEQALLRCMETTPETGSTE